MPVRSNRDRRGCADTRADDEVTGVRRGLVLALRDDENLGWFVHHLSDRMSIGEASFETDAPPDLGEAPGSPTCLALHAEPDHPSPLPAAARRGVVPVAARRGLDSPRVAEVGRFKGGTTFLLAAAGARVLSIDIAEEAQSRFLPPLEDALRRAGCASGSSSSSATRGPTTLPAESFDLAFLDADVSYEGMRADLEHWLPAVRPGGSIVVRMIDPTQPPYAHLKDRVAGVFRVVAELEHRDTLRRVTDAPPSLARFVKR